MSSYPRVRRTKIVEAFYDEFKKTNMMEHVHEHTIYNEKEDEYQSLSYKVGDLFEENQLLLDLTKQPEDIKEQIMDEIEREITSKKKFSIPRIIQYFGKHEMNNLTAKITRLSDMLANKPY